MTSDLTHCLARIVFELAASVELTEEPYIDSDFAAGLLEEIGASLDRLPNGSKQELCKVLATIGEPADEARAGFYRGFVEMFGLEETSA